MTEKPRKPKKRIIGAPSLVTSAVREVMQAYARHRRKGGTFDWLGVGNGLGGYAIVALKLEKTLRWKLVDANNDVMGAGWLHIKNRPSPELHEARAGMLPASQALGWYPKILRSLREAYEMPIVSDRDLTLHNERMWKKLGAPTNDGRYRLNPGRNPARRPRYTARELCWLNTELRLPPESRARR
jgi:hypothetical protein